MGALRNFYRSASLHDMTPPTQQWATPCNFFRPEFVPVYQVHHYCTIAAGALGA